MRKTKVYIDTSVINFLFADDSPEFKNITIDLFTGYIEKGIFDCYISEVVLAEINKTANVAKLNQLLDVVLKYKFPILQFSEESKRLAGIYINKAVIPLKKTEDALHIGLATVNNFDILLSWNFKHLANIYKRNKIKIINEMEGYNYPLDLVTPLQLMNNED